MHNFDHYSSGFALLASGAQIGTNAQQKIMFFNISNGKQATTQSLPAAVPQGPTGAQPATSNMGSRPTTTGGY
jgi:hypothetical protein